MSGDPGNDTMQGDDGIDAFFFYSGDGVDVILDFIPANEIIGLDTNINGIGYVQGSAFSVLQARISSDGAGGSFIDLGAGNSVRLVGVVPSLLDADNFAILQ